MLLRFEAVDWQSELYVNRRHIGTHRGGYDDFSYDITDALGPGGADEEIVLGVFDPTEHGNQPHGKQYAAAFAATRASSKYTSTSGIWGTVWLEFVPDTFLSDLHIVTEVGDAAATVVVNATAGGTPAAGCALNITLTDGDSTVASATGSAGTPVAVHFDSMPKLWSPASPFLYNATVELHCGAGATAEAGAPRWRRAAVTDTLSTYIGVRSIVLAQRRAPASATCAYQRTDLLPGFPRRMASAEACEAACVRPACAAWTFSATPLPPAPPPPPSPSPPHGLQPGPGIDLHGGDLPGMPIKLNVSGSAAAAVACSHLCEQRAHYGSKEERCVAWVIAILGCQSHGHAAWNFSACFLKRGPYDRVLHNKCRISGSAGASTAPSSTVRGGGTPNLCYAHALLPPPPVLRAPGSSCGHWATKLMLNRQPAPFLAGILSQGFW